ncbi:Dynein assembly factor 1, axonemal [Tetrabaena socialis]|uniref:Dynein assembly factor 1, axonemal n=1 Tax=Tetrabaena socialis TaxID=47790 RepID=A0A2J7ZVH1_9CHLO|nr:Dynein assembly factor 1, axonemal [Tetrabaena socialis]|eukprot:PNH04273.1 Dynein assembly factor 1, axonemal [Tetrabaena socialis]
MGFTLTPESLRKLCRDLKLYSSCPELNDVLHLQCKGIIKLENLDAYTGLKTLYLEQNAISDIENLDALVNLRCLYLGKNMVGSTLGLQALTNLETLDLADNVISSITDLSKLPLLRTLNISGNRLSTVDDIRDLAACPALQSLDMASNRLDAPEVVDFVMQLPLLYLRLMGNPVVSNFKHYRKTLLARMPLLNYLDDSPVFPKDRRLAEAFMAGGLEAERAMREAIRVEEEETREAHRRAFDAMVERARQQPPEPHDPMRFRAVPPEVGRGAQRLGVASCAKAAAASSLGDPEEEGEAGVGEGRDGEEREGGGSSVGEEDVQVLVGGLEGVGLDGEGRGAPRDEEEEEGAGPRGEERDLFARYSITTYGRGETAHLRQRRNSGASGGGGGGAGAEEAGAGEADGSGSHAHAHSHPHYSAPPHAPGHATAAAAAAGPHGSRGEHGRNPHERERQLADSPRSRSPPGGGRGPSPSAAAAHGAGAAGLEVTGRQDSAHEPRSPSYDPGPSSYGGRRSSVDLPGPGGQAGLRDLQQSEMKGIVSLASKNTQSSKYNDAASESAELAAANKLLQEFYKPYNQRLSAAFNNDPRWLWDY